MAKKKLILGAAAAAVVVIALAMFTSDNSRKPNHRPMAQKAAISKVQPTKKLTPEQRKQRREARKAKRRAAVLKRWAKMTPEQRTEFMKKHPGFKPPAEKPASGTTNPVSTKAKTPVTTTTKPQPAPTTTPKKTN